MAATYSTLLEEALEHWEGTRAGIIAEIENIPEDRMDFRAAHGVRTIEELGRHIGEVSLMMVGELTREDGDFTRQDWGAHMREYGGPAHRAQGRAGIIRMLRETHAEGDARLRAFGELRMLQNIRRFDGLPGTRLAWLWHGITHEEYHRAQIALCARLLGRVPALTRLITGEV